MPAGFRPFTSLSFAAVSKICIVMPSASPVRESWLTYLEIYLGDWIRGTWVSRFLINKR